jgi:alkylated DNA repair dioxygenase AlkB
MEQAALFDLPEPLPADLPEGLRYAPEFLTPQEETALIDVIRRLPLVAAQYKGYTARRRVLSFGGTFDFDANRLQPTTELDPMFWPLRGRVARWGELDPAELVHALVAEYAPGTPLGWHRDVPDFEEVLGVSLGAPAVLRFRPYPPVDPKREDVVRLRVRPRSIYLLQGAARWGWQHSVAPVDALRWSITFRTSRKARRQAGSGREP